MRSLCHRDWTASGCGLVPKTVPSASYKGALQQCAARVSHKSAPHGCPTSAPQESCKRVLYKSAKPVPQEFPTRDQGVSQERPTRVLADKSVPQECPARGSYISVSHKSVQECHKRVLQDCPTRVCYKSVKQCLAVFFRLHECIRGRGFQLIFKRDLAGDLDFQPTREALSNLFHPGLDLLPL